MDKDIPMCTPEQVERAAKAIMACEHPLGWTAEMLEAEWDSMGRGGNDFARDLTRRQARAALDSLGA
jgi:hypothetical protein